MELSPAPPGAHFDPGSPALARNRDGRLAVFAIAGDQVWHRSQDRPGSGPWRPWASLGPHAGGSFTGLAAGAHADGRLVLFAAADMPDGGTGLFQQEQTAPGEWGAVWQPSPADPDLPGNASTVVRWWYPAATGGSTWSCSTGFTQART